MPASESVEERVALRFVERVVADREAGEVRPLGEYLEAFPGHEERLRREFEDLRRRSTEPAKLGPYRLLRELGRGGQGVVYLAQDERFGRTVALKLLPRALGELGSELPARVAREMEVLSRLDHPGICVVYEAGELEGRAFLAMRYVPGRSLAEHVAELRAGRGAGEGSGSGEARRRVFDAAQLVEQLARTLHAAHEAGVVHRDVKPANVIVHDSGVPVILDFGLARSESSDLPALTRTGELLGTPHYMAPERLRGEGATDPRADVWALGVTLYELLTGARPFEAPTVEAVTRRVEHDEPEDPRRLDRAVPRDLAVVVSKALEKSPARRYASARELADDLAAVRAGEPIRARALSAPERALRWTRRNPAASVALAALAVGLVAALGVVGELRRLADENADALRTSQAHLARSRFEEGRLAVRSGDSGRSWRVLELVSAAAAARASASDDAGALPENAPALTALRNLATEALLLRDVRAVARYAHAIPSTGALSDDGAWMVARRVRPGQARIHAIEIALIDVATGDVVAASDDPRLLDAEEGIAVSGAGLVALPGVGERALEVWDLRAVERRHELMLPDELFVERGDAIVRRMWKLRFSPDGRYLAAAVVPHEDDLTTPSPRGFSVWELAGADAREPLVSGEGGEHGTAWLSFDSDSQHLVVPLGERSAGIVQLQGDARVRRHMNFEQLVRRVAMGGGDRPRLFALVDGESQDQLLVLREEGTDVATEYTGGLGCRVADFTEADLAVDAAGERLLFADRARGLRVVRATDGTELLHVPNAHAVSIGAVAFADGGARVASHGRPAKTAVWEPSPERGLALARSMPVVAPKPGEVPEARGDLFFLSADGERAAMVGALDNVNVWSWDPNNLGATWRRHEWQRDAHRMVTHIAAAPGGAGGWCIARTCEEGVTLWEGDAAARDHLVPEGAEYRGGAFTAEGAYQVVEARDDRHAVVGFGPGGAEPTRVELEHLPDCWWVDVSPQVHRALVRFATDDGPELVLFDPRDGRELPLDVGEGAIYSTIFGRFEPDGATLSMLVLRDAWRVLVWDAQTGALRADVPLESTRTSQHWSISGDGRWLVVAGPGGDAVLWDLDDAREPILRWTASPYPLVAVQFVAGGALATWDGIGPHHLWDLARLRAELSSLGVAW
ncbi:MAG: serine/threonine-protein kinase [Planctomycetota bacterium]